MLPANLAKVGRQTFFLPKSSEFLFNTPNLLCDDAIAASYNTGAFAYPGVDLEQIQPMDDK
jgi:hypothetical protein